MSHTARELTCLLVVIYVRSQIIRKVELKQRAPQNFPKIIVFICGDGKKKFFFLDFCFWFVSFSFSHAHLFEVLSLFCLLLLFYLLFLFRQDWHRVYIFTTRVVKYILKKRKKIYRERFLN